jgi:RNA polymerase sigma-70 factor (sigma-E family)
MRQGSVSSEEFGEFYAASKDRCLRAAVASGLRPGPAEDAVAEAFARAWASWSKVRRLDQPAAWVVRTAVNADISWWRRRRREVVAPALPESTTTDVSHPTDLVAAIRGLPPRQREVVVLRYLLDLDTAATAGWLGIAPGTVTAHLHHALAALRVQLTPEETKR